MRRLAEPVCLGIVAVAQVALFTRLLSNALDYDEGVYLLSLRALEAGQELGSEVFTAQPPVFYWLLRSIAFVLGDGVERVRLGITLLALVGTGAAWYLVRTIAGPAAGVLAAAMLTISPPLPLYAARVLSDLPSLWLAIVALALGALAGRRRSAVGAGASGAAAALAVGTKPSAALVLPVLLVLLAIGGGSAWRRLAWAAAGAAGVAAIVAAANLGALGDIWDGVVTYHHRAASTPAVIDRWASIHGLFLLRTPILWLLCAGAVLFVARLALRRALAAEIALWAWAALAFLFLATYSPIHYNHLVALPVPLAIAGAASLGAALADLRGRARTVAAVVLAVVVAAGFTQQWRRVSDAHEAQSPAEVAAARVLDRVTRPGDLVVSDLPVSAVLAHRLVPGPLVDTAYLRFQTGSLTPAGVLAEIDRRCVRAVVLGRALARQPVVVAGVRARFARSVTRDGMTVAYERRRPCAPAA